LFALPAATLVAYLVSNEVQFGIWLQISGIVKREPVTVTRMAVMAVVVALAVAIGRWGVRRSSGTGGSRRFRRVARFTASTAWYAGFCLVMVAYYQVLQSQQWPWYYCPVVVYLLFLLVLGVADLTETAALEAPRRTSAIRAVGPIVAIIFVPLLVALVLQTRTFTDPHLRSIELANRDAGEWINANLPADAVLASWDAGVVGYFSHRSVINLDGVANSNEYYQAARQSGLGRFLTDRSVDGIVNHGIPVDGEDPTIRAFISGVFGPEAASAATMEHAWPFIYSGETTGSSGSSSGTRNLAVFLYLLSSGGHRDVAATPG